MVTPSDTSSTPANAPSGPAKKGGGRRGGGGGGGKSLTMAAITRRVEALQKLEDVQKKKKGRQRLLHNILAGIADGSVKQPNKAAEAILSLMNVKEGRSGGKGKGKGAAAEAADEE